MIMSSSNEGRHTMPDSDAKRRWRKEHTTTLTVKLNHNTDRDILDFMQGKAAATTIKAALREYIERHPE